MAAARGVGKATSPVICSPSFSTKIPNAPIFLQLNKLERPTQTLLAIVLMKPKQLFHEIDKIFFFCRGLDSQQSGGILSTPKESLGRSLFQRFDTPASTVRIASSGDTHRPQRTPQEGSEACFRTVPSTVLFAWPCPQFLRRRRARERDLAAHLLLQEERRSSEPLAIATQHSARSAGSRSTIARETIQCRK